jgi:hypothetical protein
MKLTTHLHLVPRSKNEWSYTSTPPESLHGVALSKSIGTTLPLPSRKKLGLSVPFERLFHVDGKLGRIKTDGDLRQGSVLKFIYRSC